MYSILFIVLIFHNAGIVNVSHLPAVTKLFQRGIVFPDLFKSRIFFISFPAQEKQNSQKYAHPGSLSAGFPGNPHTAL